LPPPLRKKEEEEEPQISQMKRRNPRHPRPSAVKAESLLE
jgi:hypothetical protein